MKTQKIKDLLTLKGIKTFALLMVSAFVILLFPAGVGYILFLGVHYLGELSQNLPILSSLFSQTPYPSTDFFVGALGGVIGFILFLILIKADIKIKRSK